MIEVVGQLKLNDPKQRQTKKEKKEQLGTHNAFHSI